MNADGVKLHGTALISNTMICEVSRLFVNQQDVDPDFFDCPSESIQAYRLFDLLSLIEALALHETLYTLPANLSSDADRLGFRAALLRAGLLQELQTTDIHASVATLLVNKLREAALAPSLEKGSEGRLPVDFERSVLPNLKTFFLFDRRDPSEEPGAGWQDSSARPEVLDGTKGFYAAGGATDEALEADSFDEAARSLVRWIDYYYSGAYQNCTSIIRDMYYIFTAEHLSLPYWPQFSRINFARKFPNYFDKGFREKLYGKVASAFRTTVEEVYEDSNEQVVFIPPFAALVLERSAGPGDVLENILRVRDEFASLRRGLAEMEAERRNAETIAEMKKLRKRQQALLEDVAAHYSSRANLRLENIVRYVPELVRPLTNPVDPSKYSATLILQPAEWLRTWWRRRPVTLLFDLKTKLEGLAGYERLLGKVFAPGFAGGPELSAIFDSLKAMKRDASGVES